MMNIDNIDISGIIERIKQFIDFKSITVNKFEVNAGIARGYLARLKGSVGSDKLNGIMIAYPELSIEWLITGNGEMLKPPTPSSPTVYGEANSIKTENDVNQRIKKIIKYSGKTINAFSIEIGVSQPTMKSCIDGSNNPSFETIQKIAKRYPTISLDWLITGSGNMLKTENQNKNMVVDILKQHNQEKESLKNQLEQAIEERDRSLVDKDRALAMLEKALSR